MICAILIFDLFAQAYYFRGALYTAPEWTRIAPWIGLIVGGICVYVRPSRRLAVVLLAAIHYAVTYVNGQAYSEADTWIWLLVIALAGLPDEGEVTRSYWVGALRLVGFLVYLFAGLHKMIHHDWWTGEAMRNVYLDHMLMNDSYQFLGRIQWIAQALCIVTLVQRLVVPWGLWSRDLRVRRITAGILAVMHFSYVMTMNIGTFSWVGFAYLSQFFFPVPDAKEDYYKLPSKKGMLGVVAAAAFAVYLVVLPTIDFAQVLGAPGVGITHAVSPPGFQLNWGMFSNISPTVTWPAYSVKTCSGRELHDDEILWDFGTSGDYFRRRVFRVVFNQELLTSRSGPGPYELRLFENFQDRIRERRVRVLEIAPAEAKVVGDSGDKHVADCKKN